MNIEFRSFLTMLFWTRDSYLNQGIHGLAKNSFFDSTGKVKMSTVDGHELEVQPFKGLQPRIFEILPETRFDTISKNILSSFWVEKFYYIHCSQINLNGSFKKMNLDVYCM